MIEKITSPKNMPIPRRLKKLVNAATKRHAWNIGVSNYTGDILYMESDEKRTDGNVVLASCDVDRRYLRATIKIFPELVRRWKREGDQYVEDAIAHEVAHVATQHLFDVAVATYRDEGEMKDAWETLTEVVARLSIKLDKQLR